MQGSIMGMRGTHAGGVAAHSHTQASLAGGGGVKLADWDLEAVVRSGAALH